MKSRIISVIALAASLVAGSAAADTKTVCNNLNLVSSGYLLVEKNIIMGKCPTGKGSTWSTPYDGLVILHSEQLIDFNPPYAVVTRDGAFGAQPKYIIKAVKDGLSACVTPVVRPYGFFTLGDGNSSSCGSVSPDMNNRLTYNQHMWVELARPAGKPGELRVKLNSKYKGPGRYYAITTTSTLHGGTTSFVKTPLQQGKSYSIKELGPEFASQAKQGATFSFKVEAFVGPKSVAKYTLKATGKEMIKN